MGVSGKEESGNLDLLRATAVMIVLIFHLMLFEGVVEIGGRSIRGLGLFGVLLFFVHTTLVLMYSMRRQQAQFPGKPLFTLFMIRRIFRIYPLSTVVIILIGCFRIPQAHLSIHEFSWVSLPFYGWLANVALMQNVAHAPAVLGVLWSLPFEIQMYTLLPALYLFANRSRRAVAIFGVWCVAVAVYFAAVAAHVGFVRDLVQFAPCFIPGVIAYRLSAQKARIPWPLWPVFIGLLIAAFTAFSGTYQGWLACLALGFGIPFFQEIPAGVVKTAAHLVAKYSYGIYLTHYFSIWLAFSVLRNGSEVVKIAVFTSTALLIPVILFHTIEQPLIRVGNKVVKRLAAAVTSAQPAPARAMGAVAE